ncbi:MAG: ABC transporter ATP-binding protein [Lachnospiraceae bacterium]|nr:ABC transporter ATP-binding protein [Lachnospiraceae bacterium]
MWFKKQKDTSCSTVMRDKNNILEIDNLQVYFNTEAGVVKAVDGVTIDIPKNSTIGIVGESGCGKSVTSLTTMRLLQEPPAKICGGEIRLNRGNEAIDIAKASQEKMREIRGKDIAMIFQEPMTSLNPVFTIGEQMQEGILVHEPGITRKELADRVISLLNMVGIARPEGVVKSYPHELSGGMKQRIVIAMALSLNPSLVIADEPTTALDVTIQAQVLELMRDLKQKTKASIMLITHDLGVVAEMADYVVVMYAGRVVEQGTVMEIFKDPRHPYTRGLLKSRPSADASASRLFSISGNVPNPIGLPNYCYFKNRCDTSCSSCEGEYPVLREVTATHKVSCHVD